MENRTREFIKYYNNLEKKLKNKLGIHDNITFSELVKRASNKDSFIKSKQKILRSLGDLRNVLTHNEGQKIMAIPSEESVSLIKNITAKFLNPPLLYSICNNPVETIPIDYDFVELLNIMKVKDFSQIPVYNGNDYIGLITGNVISRWFASHTDIEGNIIENVKGIEVQQILEFREENDSVSFLPRKINVFEFIEKNKESLSNSGVYIITETGKNAEKPLSIVTTYDIPNILKELEALD